MDQAQLNLNASWDSVADALLTTASNKLNLEDFSSLLHDSLLFSEPALERHPLGEEGVLQLALGTGFLRAGDAGRDFEQAHGWDP